MKTIVQTKVTSMLEEHGGVTMLNMNINLTATNFLTYTITTLPQTWGYALYCI